MRPSNRPRRAWFPVAVVALASLFSSGAFAKPVAKEDAAKAVSGWLKQPGHGLKARIGNAVKETAVFNDAAGNPEYFVVYLKPSGFVIVPADDLVEPIIGFCPAGRYVASNKNALGALVMRDIPARLALARAKQPAAALQPRMKSAQGKWAKLMVASGAPAGMIMNPLSSVSDLRVAPLVQTLWSQDVAGDDTDIACYNYYTPPGPNGDENNDPCGCVATAMAQLMYYTWTQDSAFLSNGVGTASFPISADGTPEDAYLLGGNGDGGPYDWAKMVLNPDNNITTAQCEAIWRALLRRRRFRQHGVHLERLRNLIHPSRRYCSDAGIFLQQRHLRRQWLQQYRQRTDRHAQSQPRRRMSVSHSHLRDRQRA